MAGQGCLEQAAPAAPVEDSILAPLMLELARLVQHPELPVEGGEQPGVGGHVLHAHGLPDGVHGERGHPQVDGPDADPRRDDGPDRGAAGTVVSHLVGMVRTVRIMRMRMRPRVAPRTTNSCTGASARLASSRSRKPVSALVAYLPAGQLLASAFTHYTTYWSREETV